MSDRALQLLSGRADSQPQPVEVAVVMTDRALVPAAFGGARAPSDDVAVVPGWGPLSGAEARSRIEDLTQDAEAQVWLRRLFTDPTGRDLVAMDSRRRFFHGGLRRSSSCASGLDGTGPHGIRLSTPSGQTHDAMAPPILGEGWTPPAPDDWLDDDFETRFCDWLEDAHEGHSWVA